MCRLLGHTFLKTFTIKIKDYLLTGIYFRRDHYIHTHVLDIVLLLYGLFLWLFCCIIEVTQKLTSAPHIYFTVNNLHLLTAHAHFLSDFMFIPLQQSVASCAGLCPLWQPSIKLFITLFYCLIIVWLVHLVSSVL